MSKRKRRSYSQEFKASAVDMVENQGYRVEDVCRHLDINRSNLNRWRRDLGTSGQEPAPQADDQEARLRKLEEENRQLREEREILKKAAAFFANESN
mgnify:CR=1 FL=1